MRRFDRYRRQPVLTNVEIVFFKFSAVDDVLLYRYIVRSLYKEQNAPIASSLPQRRGLKGQ